MDSLCALYSITVDGSSWSTDLSRSLRTGAGSGVRAGLWRCPGAQCGVGGAPDEEARARGGVVGVPDGQVAVPGAHGEDDADQPGLLEHLADGGKDEVLPQLADGARLVADLEDPAAAVGEGLRASTPRQQPQYYGKIASRGRGAVSPTSHIGVSCLRKRYTFTSFSSSDGRFR